jgi:hypothetical protein
VDELTHYREPSQEAFRIRDAVRAKHARCSTACCALAHIWAEDVQAILDLGEEMRK